MPNTGRRIPMMVRLSPPDAERVRRLAAASDRSVSGELCQAVKAHLNSESPATTPSSRNDDDPAGNRVEVQAASNGSHAPEYR
jgi:hypothetical protein